MIKIKNLDAHYLGKAQTQIHRFSKSIKLVDLLPILSIKDIEFYNIQYTNEEDELKIFKDQYNIEIKNVKI